MVSDTLRWSFITNSTLLKLTLILYYAMQTVPLIAAGQKRFQQQVADVSYTVKDDSSASWSSELRLHLNNASTIRLSG